MGIWRKRKERRRERKKLGVYNWVDMLFDILFLLPELLFLPIRLVFYLIRGMGKFMMDMFNV
ncbi:hypothetical protein [Pontibacillus marinus]|uniref:Uncharacterized protein n=1 Tax=Pontibacillus marinus BH030004 = DSM 16465 TaxID=1385511 RepID=A0A0A5G3C6_9BACI|nr:hypothetical protein [Pontibacillus marinus]KGX87616.1 hypothetical protein N783_09370 [Pontibacillus marinus BH030004 = DSM 16465]